jgi:hypothetical protein
MMAKKRAVETLAGEKTRRRSLLPQLHCQPLLEIVQLAGRKARMKQDLQRQRKPGVEVIAQSGGAKMSHRRAELRRAGEACSQFVGLFGDLFAVARFRSLA